MEFHSDEEYKFIMLYQDQLTKFVQINHMHAYKKEPRKLLRAW